MNQNYEQLARYRMYDQLIASGCILQDKKSFNLSAGVGVAIRECQTGAVPADYILFVIKKLVGLIEAKREEEGVRLTTVEEQSNEYASAKLKYINNDPLAICVRKHRRIRPYCQSKTILNSSGNRMPP